jgi:hypothetical protein
MFKIFKTLPREGIVTGIYNKVGCAILVPSKPRSMLADPRCYELCRVNLI